MTPLLGVFVGGAARRMGFVPKGLIHARTSGESLVAHSLGEARALALDVCFVGDVAAYARAFPDVPVLRDAPAGVGPLGGLRALCMAAGTRPVITLACDLPFASRALLSRLCAPSAAAIVAPRNAEGFWEPLAARYDPARVLAPIDQALARGALSLQALLSACAAEELTLDEHERAALVDWDCPSDVAPDYALPRD